MRNVAYQKSVAVRFTLDEWHTTNDVVAGYEKSLGGLPLGFGVQRFSLSSTVSGEQPRLSCVTSPSALDPMRDPPVREGAQPAWDRFRFEINMEDWEHVLEGRVMWLVGRFGAGGAPPPPSAATAEGSANSSTGTGTGNGSTANGTTNGVGLTRATLPGPEPYAEWWDNNGGANYRVGFRRREVPAVAASGMAKTTPVEAYRRGVVVSAPCESFFCGLWFSGFLLASGFGGDFVIFCETVLRSRRLAPLLILILLALAVV